MANFLETINNGQRFFLLFFLKTITNSQPFLLFFFETITNDGLLQDGYRRLQEHDRLL